MKANTTAAPRRRAALRRIGGLALLAIATTAPTARGQWTNGFFGTGSPASSLDPTRHPGGLGIAGPSYYYGGSYTGYYFGRGYVGPSANYAGSRYGGGVNYAGSHYGGGTPSYPGPGRSPYASRPAPSYAMPHALPRDWVGVSIPR